MGYVYQLPTEAQWEYAARAGTSTLYSFGNYSFSKLRDYAWYGDDSGLKTHPVGTKLPNSCGLYDMYGNVWEWCSDWYRPDYYETLQAASRVARNPPGPDDSLDPAEPGVPKRVQRGGSFLCTDQYCTRYMVGSRGKGEPSTGSNHLGFRCVRSPKSP